MPVAKIEKATYRERVYNELMNNILLGELRPGQVLTLKSLSEQFGVSIIPIREALFQLEAEKIVDCTNNKEIKVKLLTAGEFTEIMSLRELIESKTAEKACANNTEENILELESLIVKLNKNVKNPRRYIGINREFHFKIYSFADLPITMDLIMNLWTRIGPYIYIYTEHTGSLISIEFHHQMYEAFKEGNKEKMSLALRSDLNASCKEIQTYIANGMKI